MTELSLAGIHDNGTQVILTDPDGNEYLLPITDELRSAVRRDREMVERLRASTEPPTPRTIQSMLRAGATVDEVAEATQLSREHVERFEGPVLAERAWIVQQAQNLAVGRHPDSPTLGDLVVDRLATRKVSPDDLEWSAERSGTDPWTLVLEFPVAGHVSTASWEVDLSARSLHATNDEARWLSETDASSPRARGGFGGIVQQMPAREPEHAPTPAIPEEDDSTDSLLKSLAESRGVRQPAPEFGDDPDLLDELGEEEAEAEAEAEERTPARVISMRRREKAAAPSPEKPAEAAPVEEPEETPAEEEPMELEEPKPAPKPARRGNRRSVPSWDEIVFGSKSDS